MAKKELRRTIATQKAVSRIAELYEKHGKIEDAKKARKHSDYLSKKAKETTCQH